MGEVHKIQLTKDLIDLTTSSYTFSPSPSMKEGDSIEFIICDIDNEDDVDKRFYFKDINVPILVKVCNCLLDKLQIDSSSDVTIIMDKSYIYLLTVNSKSLDISGIDNIVNMGVFLTDKLTANLIDTNIEFGYASEPLSLFENIRHYGLLDIKEDIVVFPKNDTYISTHTLIDYKKSNITNTYRYKNLLSNIIGAS